ncbi:MAG TPA: TraR/DksA C4-type zinc finger protein [Ferruginibacter sp.]|nr:TraR/DksA C4-type zinc finger protein [Ferruginibacter sp.]
MATKKKAAKPAAKKTAKPVKKSAPVKKVAPKKPAAKKTVTKKTASKPVVKKLAKVIKKVSKKAIVVKKSVKPVAKATEKKHVVKPMKKKVEVKKVVTKPVAVKKTPAKPVTPVKAKSPEKAKDIKITPAKAVVLPKINTKTSRKYQPEFTKSILDQPKHDLGAPIVRYNDTDLAEFRDIIQRKLDSAKKELTYLQGLITRKDEMGGDNDDARYMTMEDGSMSMEREQLSQMASRQITFIDHLEKAIMRIENKTYGICRVTGQLIDKARLRAVPHATLSMEAKMGAMK